MRLVVTADGVMLSDVTCEREPVYIGSRGTCRVHLIDERIAEQHVVLNPDGEQDWILQPLDLGVPVQMGGKPVTSPVKIQPGDEFEILEYKIQALPSRSAESNAATSRNVAQLAKFAAFQLPPGSVIKKDEESLVVQPGQASLIGRLNLRLSDCIVVEDLMSLVLKFLHQHFSAHRAWIGVRQVNYGPMEYTEGQLRSGQAAGLTDVGDKLKPRVLDRGQFVLVPRVSRDERVSVMAGPLPGLEHTLGMLYVDTGDTGSVFSDQDFDFFMLCANLFGVQLDAIFKEMAKNRQATMQGEVIVAHEIQARITPRKLSQWDELQLGAFREPGREHSGDIYDVVRLSNDMAAIMVGHTQAVGAMPAMLMAQVQSAFRFAAAHLISPHVFMRSLNRILYDGQKDHPFDCFMGIIDPKSGDMRYSIAGQLGAYIIDARGTERSLMPGDPTPSLGTAKSITISGLPEQLDNGESLAVFTPGVTSAKNRSGEVFGEDRFVNLLCDGFGQLASTMLKEMFADLRNFTEGGLQPYDVTVLLAHHV
jgi:serine phosphatase RsbU (regulator of sigma subunit)